MNAEQQESPKYERYVSEIVDDFVQVMEKQYKLHCYGSGGSMPTDVEKIEVLFISYSKATIDDARKMEINAVQELLCRIKAILRRGKEPERVGKTVKFNDFHLDVERYMLKREDKMIPLTLSEFGILRRLISNRGKVLTRNQLLDDINNDDSFIVDRNIDVHIASLRKKLGPTFDWIETVRGVGYRFREDPAVIEK